MNRLKNILIVIIVGTLIFLSACTGTRDFEATHSNGPAKALSLVFASDLHYLSPKMTDYGERFMEIIEHSDGKVTHYTPEIVRAFVSQILKSSPDAVILSGDLTLNGDEKSHEELVELLMPIKEAGIGLFVMPGNHDVDGTAYQFSGDDVVPIAGTPSDKFNKMYENMGWLQAFSKDDSSLSYTVKLTEDIWLLMIDVNGYGMRGYITEEILSWIKEELEQAKESGATVIGVSHQNLMCHNKLFPFGYQIIGGDDLIKLYREYEVKLHFSGHMHMQHIMQMNDIIDIATSSMAVTPNQYGLLEIDSDRSMFYKTIPVDVSTWAVENGKTDENLLEFTEYSMDFFDKSTEYRILDILESNNISQETSQEDMEKMKTFAVEANRHYFAGTLLEEIFLADDSGFSLWKEKLPNEFFTLYFENMLEQDLENMNYWTSDK